MEKLIIDAKTSEWLSSLDDAQRLLARDEARRYESLREEERDSIWNAEVLEQVNEYD